MRMCDFCGASERKADTLIAHEHAHICNECVMLCVDILAKLDKPNYFEEQTND